MNVSCGVLDPILNESVLAPILSKGVFAPILSGVVLAEVEEPLWNTVNYYLRGQRHGPRSCANLESYDSLSST